MDFRIRTSRTDRDWRGAQQKVGQAGLAPESHVILTANVDHYLRQIDGCDSGWDALRLDGKLRRDLAEPYTDAEVFSHLRNLEREVGLTLSAIPSPPRATYLVGGLAQGRFGAHSDADLVAVLSDESEVQRASERLGGVDGVTLKTECGPSRLETSQGCYLELVTPEDATENLAFFSHRVPFPSKGLEDHYLRCLTAQGFKFALYG